MCVCVCVNGGGAAHCISFFFRACHMVFINPFHGHTILALTHADTCTYIQGIKV